MEREIWKDIINYEGVYAISNLGRVKRYAYNKETKKKGCFYSTKERVLKNTKGSRGYPQLTLYLNQKKGRFTVHRLMALNFIPNPHNKPHVNHMNGIKSDNRIDNLEWCTHKENMEHALGTGLIIAGENCSWSKLTETMVKSIKRSLLKGEERKKIANRYGVSKGCISSIHSGRTWKLNN